METVVKYESYPAMEMCDSIKKTLPFNQKRNLKSIGEFECQISSCFECCVAHLKLTMKNSVCDTGIIAKIPIRVT